MDIKEIVKNAKEYFSEMFSDRIYDNIILLEEVELLADNKWKITLGFYEKKVNNQPFAGIAFLENNLTKAYKILFVDEKGKVEKIKNYD